MRWRLGVRWYAVALLATPLPLFAILWPLSAFVDPAFAPRFQWPLFAIGLGAASFAVGAELALAVTALVPERGLIFWVLGASLVFLALLGVIAARAGGAGVLVGTWRVTFWDALAMAATAAVGSLFGTVV